MFRDLIASLITTCSPHIRGLGYLDETLAMRKRHRARKVAWQSHLDRSKQFVLAAAKQCAGRNKVVILGSGLLLDVPLAGLSSLFREVVLMDVVCLPETEKQIGKFGNARFAEHDVTGISEQLYRNSQTSRGELPEVNPPFCLEYENADLVVSLNILSQLWVIPRTFVMKQRTRAGQEQLDDWCEKLVEAHYAFLRSLQCAVCLVADYAFIKRDKDGGVIGNGSSVYNLGLPKPESRWTWDIAPLGSESTFFSKELIVGAWNVSIRDTAPGSIQKRIHLRPVLKEDVHAVSQWPPYTGVLEQMDYALRSNGWLNEFFGRQEAACFIAEADGSLVGFALLLGSGENRTEVRIALHPDRTGRGLGEQVMRAVLEKGFSDPGVDRIDLIVRKNNEPALKLYKRLGFSFRGESRHEIQGRAIHFFDMDISREDFVKLREREAGQ